MSLDPITMSLAAKKAKADLARNGQIGYTREGRAVLASVTDGEFVEGAYSDAAQFALSAGKSYVVTWDGQEYKCVAALVEEHHLVFIGNPYIAGGGEDNGVPFVMFYIPEMGVSEINSLTDGVHSFTVEEITKTIVRIDPKYLPAGSGGGLPVVELETVIDTKNPSAFSQADSDKLTAAHDYGTPVVFKFTVDGIEFSHVFTRMASETDSNAFQTTLYLTTAVGLTVFMFVRISETRWTLMLQNLNV